MNIDRSIFDARKGFSEKDFKNIEKDFQPFNANFNYLKKNGTRMGVKGKGWSNENIGAFRQLEISIAKNEKAFSDSKLAFQYNDEFSNMNSNQILMKMKECLKEGKNDEAQKYFDVLKRRMLENKYMSKHGGPKAFIKGRFADFSDSDLAFRYEEAKSNNNKGEILECEAEMALRAKDYSAYESKFDELQMFKLGKNNEDSVENTNIEKETYTSRQTTNTENESNSVRKMKNANRETGISSNNDNIASDTDGESSGVVEAGIKMDNPFKKLFRKNNRKTVREMSQKRNAREMSQKRNSREENNVRSNVNLNMNSVRNIDERENVEEEANQDEQSKTERTEHLEKKFKGQNVIDVHNEQPEVNIEPIVIEPFNVEPDSDKTSYIFRASYKIYNSDQKGANNVKLFNIKEKDLSKFRFHHSYRLLV